MSPMSALPRHMDLRTSTEGPRRYTAKNEPWLQSTQGQYRAEYVGTSPLRAKPTASRHQASATYTDPAADCGENISAFRRERKVQLVKTAKIKELIAMRDESAARKPKTSEGNRRSLKQVS